MSAASIPEVQPLPPPLNLKHPGRSAYGDTPPAPTSIPKTPPSRKSFSLPGPRTTPRPASRRDHYTPATGGSSSEFELPMSSVSTRSTRQLRPQESWEDDYHTREREQSWDPTASRNNMDHPDIYTRRSQSFRTGRRPPRAFLNRPWQVEDPETPSRPTFDETRSTRNLQYRDEEMGFGGRTGSDSGTLAAKIDWKNLSKEEKAEVLRLPWIQWMNSNAKDHFVSSLGEFVGTTLFLLFAFAGTEVANIQSQAGSSNTADSNSTTGAATGFDVSVLLYISIIFGFSLMVNVWIFFRISGGLFNPAVTFAMFLVKAISATRAVCLFVAQILGSLLASVIVRFLLPENFNVRTTLTGGATLAQGVFIEAILTAELVFTIFMLAKEKHRATFIAPVGIGLALFIAEMVGVQFTGGSLNPARSFGPCVITLTFDQEHWIYWVGPLLGALIAVVFYRFIKTLEYEMANPGADGDPLNDPTQNPEKLAELKSKKSMASSSFYT
ncbi:aquaporin-like protein [Xylariaceae sp. FL0016]|nr:aquaporin-like protein [Xylariaceae sp. FL0016]